MSDEPKQCTSVLNSAQRTIALAFDLVGATVDNLPSLVAGALQSPEVEKAIRAALEEQGKKLVSEHKDDQKGGTIVVTPEKVQGAGEAVGKAALNAGLTQLEKKIKDSPEAKALQKSAEQLLEDFKCSPTGVFVDNNKTVLIIVGSVIAVAGVTSLYVFKFGDEIGKPITGKAVQVKLGKLSLSGKLTKFEPSTRTLGAELTLGANWKSIDPKQANNVKLTVAGTAGEAGAEGSAKGEVTVQLAPHLSGIAKGQVTLRTPGYGPGPNASAASPTFDYSGALGLRITQKSLSIDVLGQVRNGQPTLGASVGIDRKLGPARARLDLGADYRPWAPFGTPQNSRFRTPSDLPPSVDQLFPNDSRAAVRLGATLRLEFP